MYHTQINVMSLMKLFILYLNFVPFVAPDCVFPDNLQNSTWITSTLLSEVTFNSSHVGPLLLGGKTMSCYVNEGTKYVVRSDVYVYGPFSVRDYTCLHLQEVTLNKYIYRELTLKDPNQANDRIVVESATATPNVTDICTDVETPAVGTYSFMVLKGSVNESKIECPQVLVNSYNATFTGCDAGAIVDVCNDNTTVDFNYTTCGGSSYSGEMLFNCLYTMTTDGKTYVTLYNDAEDATNSNPFIPFSCLVAGSITGGTQQITQSPGDCKASQTATSVPAPGVAFDMDVTSACGRITTQPPTTTPATTSSATTKTTTEEPGVENTSPTTLASMWMLLLMSVVSLWTL